jgi:hypothetical protein
MAYNITRVKLQEYTDSKEFERLCCALLVADHKGIIPLGGSRDSGLDAIEPPPFPGLYQDEECGTVFQFSLQQTWRKKLTSELKKVTENAYKPSLYIFVTTQEVNSEARTKYRELAKNKYKVNLNIYDLKWLQLQLESPEYLSIRRTYLSLDESTLPAFLNLSDYAVRRIDRLRAPDFPLFVGRDSEVASINQFVSSKTRVLLLSAPPGIGKTKLMLEIAKHVVFEGDTRFLRQDVDSITKHLDELDPQKALLLFIDDAHELKDIKQLIALILSPELGEKTHVIMAIHPWAKDRIVADFSSLAINHETIDLKPLNNLAIDQLIQLPEIGIKDEDQRGAVIRLAEGNPLVAYVASCLLKETGTLAGLTRHQIITAHFMKSLEGLLPRKPENEKARLLIAIIGATKGIEYGNFRQSLADTIGITVESLDVLVQKLETTGLLRRSWRGLRVTPDLLAENIVFDSFFATGHQFDFKETVLTPFFIQKGSKIFESLAEAELSGSAEATGIIDQFVTDAKKLIKTSDNALKQNVIDWLKGFAFFRPEDALLILRSMLESPIAEPTIVKSPDWGTMTIRIEGVRRSACNILTETGWHCETCLRETMRLLYLIGSQEDHSRSNSYPMEDAIRVLNEQVIPFKPGQPIYVQEAAIQEIETWLISDTSESQLEVIISALMTLVSITWHTTGSFPTNSRVITLKDGLIKITEPLQKIRSKAFICINTAYQRCKPGKRVLLIHDLSSRLAPYTPSEIPDDIRAELANDAFKIISVFKDQIKVDNVAERYALWTALEYFDRLQDERLIQLKRGLFDAEIDLYHHLTEWPSHIRKANEDWKSAEARHNAYWEQQAKSITSENLNVELSHYDHLVEQASLSDEKNTSAIQVNIGILVKFLRISNKDILLKAVQEIEEKYDHLQRYAGIFLGELFIVNPETARSFIKKWVISNNTILRLEAGRAMTFIHQEQFEAREVELINYMISLNDPQLDRMICGWFGNILRKVDYVDSKAAIEIVSTVSSRKDKFALNMVADALQTGESISKISAKELSDIIANFVEFDEHELDFDIHGMLMRLFLLGPDAWLTFWEMRIKRQQTKKEGDRYLAVPFHLSGESEYVVDSPDKNRVLGTFLEWSSRDDFAYHHSGSTLFKLFSGNNPNIVQEILDDWIASGELVKLRSVARILNNLGYSDFFLSMAARLLEATDDTLVEAYLRSTVGSIGAKWGSLVPIFEKRKADFEAWITNPQSSLRAKAFARKQVLYLSKQIELNSKEDEWDN